MNLQVHLTTTGIDFVAGEVERLTISSTANQLTPKRSYVYGHYDDQGVPFYIGKGTGRRAWSEDRHRLWDRYVRTHLNGKYSVHILADDLSPEQAEELEGEWVAQESDTLVNWVNSGRISDYEAIRRCNDLHDINRALVSQAKEQEATNLEDAITTYQKALSNLAAYSAVQPQSGLVGKLIDEERSELGIAGEIHILDRLTLCLVKAGRTSEAVKAVEAYFHPYRRDLDHPTTRRIKARIEKAAKNGG